MENTTPKEVQEMLDAMAAKNNIIDLDAYAWGLQHMYEHMVSRPLTVIAPTIEWGEWEKGGWMFSKCMRYQISAPFSRDGNSLHRPWFLNEGNSQWLSNERLSIEEAKAACQAHAQAAVDKSLEGCKVERYRDPQPLENSLVNIYYAATALVGDSDDSMSDREFREYATNEVSKSLTPWRKANELPDQTKTEG